MRINRTFLKNESFVRKKMVLSNAIKYHIAPLDNTERKKDNMKINISIIKKS